ncbi:hypothetical protein FRB97_000916 [Tulasnella sp. 331]|nr:hypothetical protein FRB97_000916 [Tulasnella sp. 331]
MDKGDTSSPVAPVAPCKVPFLTPGTAFSNEFDSSPEPSPSRPVIVLGLSHPSNKLEALKQALAHTHCQIGTLKGTIQREKEQKLQYKKQLGKDTLLTLPNSWENEDDEQDNKKPLRTVSLCGIEAGSATIECHTSINDWKDELMASTKNECDLLLGEDVERSPTKPLWEEDHKPSPVDLLEEPPSLSAKLTAATASLKKTHSGVGFKAHLDSIVAPPSSLVNELNSFSSDNQAGYSSTYSTVLEEFENEARVPGSAKEIMMMPIPTPVYADMCVQAELVEEEKAPEPVPIPTPILIPIPIPIPIPKPMLVYSKQAIATNIKVVPVPPTLINTGMDTDTPIPLPVKEMGEMDV